MADQARPATFGRYPEVPIDEMTPEQKEGLAVLMETRGKLPGPAKIYVDNTRLAKVLGPLGAHFRKGYKLTAREREIAVCVVSAKLKSAYVNAAHEKSLLNAGVPADKVDAIFAGLTTSFDDPREQVIYEMSVCLCESRWIPQGLYERAVKLLGHDDITDVIALIGFYTTVCLTCCFYDVPAGAKGIR